MFKGNRVYKLDKNGKKKRFFGFIFGMHISFRGKNSEIIFGNKIPNFKKCKIRVGSNCKVVIQNTKHSIRHLDIIANGNNITCAIGKNFQINSGKILFANEDNLSVKIGDSCMFAHDILIRPSDAHCVTDMDNKVTNKGKDITFEDGVWLTGDITVLKGVTIAKGSIIGHGSIVTKSCEEPNSLYAGVPAKKLKNGIRWHIESPDKYEK